MRIHVAIIALAVALIFTGCRQGPGHTRAAGAGLGTAAGAIIGAAASPYNRAGGAAIGSMLGLVAGSLVGDGIASDQERCCPPPCDPCCQPAPCAAPCGQPAPVRIIRRRYVRPDGTLIREEEIIEEDIVVDRGDR